jgi:small subunit ribosomal protein S20
MAHNASARKRHRQSLERAARNKHWRSTVRNAVRRARRAAEERAPDAAQQMQRAERMLRKAGSKGVVHARTVSRTVSRLRHLARRTG